MTEIELFLQGEGCTEIILIRVSPQAKMRDLLELARRAGVQVFEGEGGSALFREGEEDPLTLDEVVEAAGLKHRGRVHLHRCRKVQVTVHYNGTRSNTFPPSATVKHIKHWAVGEKGFNLSSADALEHALQLTGSTTRPPDDAHLGTLVQAQTCSVSFDLVPKVRVEG